jgi:hypothetical protein
MEERLLIGEVVVRSNSVRSKISVESKA